MSKALLCALVCLLFALFACVTIASEVQCVGGYMCRAIMVRVCYTGSISMLMLLSVFLSVITGVVGFFAQSSAGPMLSVNEPSSLSFGNSTIPEQSWHLTGDEEPQGAPQDTEGSPEPLVVSRQQYNAALSQPPAEYLGSAPSTTSQGLEVHWEEYDAFFPYIVLGVSLPEIPGMDRLAGQNEFNRRAYLTVNRVLDAAGANVYDAENSFEEAPFNGLSLRPIEGLQGYLEGGRQIHVKDGVKEENLRLVDGQVVLKLPVNIQSLEFVAADLGKEKKTPGATISLSAIEGADYTFDYLGKGENFVKFVGYSTDGKMVAIASRTADVTDSEGEPTPISVSFEAPVSKIKIFVADEIYTKTLPFTLKVGK